MEAAPGLQQAPRRHNATGPYRIVLVRLRYHQPTKDYLTRRLAKGKPKNEIIRCLKRYIAREVFTALQPALLH